MDTSEPIENPLKRTFDQLYSKPKENDDCPTLQNIDPPSRYQIEIFQAARKRNTIAVLDTGTSKTLIATMLVKDICQATKSRGQKKLIVFLAPTVHLVHQQYNNLKCHTDFQVEEYYGAKRVDTWDLEAWEKEIRANDVLVMTPQILLDALSKAFLKVEMISLMIIDECHIATGNHPYAKIMKEFYHRANEKPMIFGMTASTVVKRGNSSPLDCEGQISELESILDSQRYTVEDRTEIDVCNPSIKESCVFYDPARLPALSLKPKIEALWSKSDALLSEFQSNYKDVDNKFKTLHQQMSKQLAEILYCIEDLGLFCAYEAVKICREKFSKVEGECEVYQKGFLQCMTVIEDISQIFEDSIHLADKTILDVEFDYSKAVEKGYISPKLHELIRLFQTFRESNEVLCLIFVERIIAAEVIQRLVKKVPHISHSFRSGKVNLLFTTDVLEEGSHVTNCSCVIRFDLPKTVCSYVQSRGRCRRANSQYISMLESGNLKQRHQQFELIRTERSEACKKLHQVRAFREHLVPFVKEPSEAHNIVKNKEASSGAGTTKRKELHGTTSIRALCGTWGDKLEGVNFHAYKFEFTCSIVSEIYSGFVLLIESKLDGDVGNIELDLYLVSKIVKASVSSCGKVDLDAEQVMKAKHFHELFFNGLFGRLISRSKSTPGERDFLLQEDTQSLWSPKNMYLLLPLQKSDDVYKGPLQIHWSGITSCVSAIEFVRRKCSPVAEDCDCDTSPLNGEENTDKIHFANCVIDINDMKDMVVLAIHTGKVYSIVEVVMDLSGESPFDGNNEKSKECMTFSDYFHKRYGITLRHPGQPLLRLKQSHNSHNLLFNFHEKDAGGKSSQTGPVASKVPAHVHVPPELLYFLDVKRDVQKSLYLLPSLMHRIETLMLSSQLRDEINGQASNFNISSSLILQALTTSRCCENFSMERLELLGDSVLKYVVSCHLFLKYPEKHEGQLTAMRQQVICNSTLHKLGMDRKLQGYILDSAFEPRRWVAPGQRSIFPVSCECGLETPEVPMDAKFHSEDPKVVVGKSCDRGHRWMCSKTIADCVESLIGAYYADGGLIASLHVMKWLGIDAELEPSMVDKAITVASLHQYVPKEIICLEKKIGYEFSFKGLLLEATTHLSGAELGNSCSYERLEFLGDSVLDLLITWHLYQSHTDIREGELTELRSASVNNENFAQVAVRRNLHPHLLHSSEVLINQISEYAKVVSESENNTLSLLGIKAPKALGDLVESIAGAILIDSKLSLDKVWNIFKPLLSPIVTPDNLELIPSRKLSRLCDTLGYFVKAKENYDNKEPMEHVELSVQLPNAFLVQEGKGPNKRIAKEQAAFHLLNELEKRGLSYFNGMTKGKMDNGGHIRDDFSISDEHSLKPAHKRIKLDANLTTSPSAGCLPVKDSSNEASDVNASIPVISFSMKKGEPRSKLNELCKRLQWPLPSFDSTEYKDRRQFGSCEGLEGTKGQNCFVSTITMCIPNDGTVECRGEVRGDKKSSFDSAAVKMIHELKKLGKLKIDDSQ